MPFRNEFLRGFVHRAQGGVIEVSKISSQDRMLQKTREQFLDVPVPLLKEQLVEVLFSVSRDELLLVEQIIGFIRFETVFASYCGAVFRVVSAGREVQF